MNPTNPLFATNTAGVPKTGGETTPSTIGLNTSSSFSNPTLSLGIYGPAKPADLNVAKATQTAVNQKATALASSNNSVAVTPNNKIIASSAPAINEENNIKSEVANLNKTVQNAPVFYKAKDGNYYDQYGNKRDAGQVPTPTAVPNSTAIFDDYAAKLAARRAEEIKSINEQFDSTIKQTKKDQYNETESNKVALQRIGGYLGGTVSAVGALNNLAETHRTDIATLEAKRAAAIRAANQAIDDEEFKVAQAKAKEARDISNEIEDRNQKFFDNALKLSAENRNSDVAMRNKAEDQLKAFATVGLDKIDPNALAEIDNYYGVKGFSQNYINTVQATNSAKTEKEIADARKSTLEFLQSIPAGQKITMPDGTSFTGLGKAADVSTFLQVDSSGIGHVVAFNKLTGEKNVTNVGLVGKGSNSISSVSPVAVDNAVNIVQTTLESTKDKTGKYDPDKYIELRSQIKKSDNPQLLPYIDKMFLNPSNQYFSDAAINRLRSKGIYYGDVSLPPEQNPTDTITKGDQ